MAASGNAEHLEAIRKQRVIDRQAYKKKLLRESFQQDLGENPNLIGTEKQYSTSYDREVDLMRKVGSPPGIPKSSPNPHNAAAVDRYRRQQLRQQQLVEYSAKLPNRYSSVDYISQW